VAPSSASFPAEGGGNEVTVTASAADCAWTATAGSPWIALASTGGTGSGVVAYTVAGHTSTASRSGTLTVAGTAVSITQAAAPAPPEPCTFTVGPLSAAYPSDGGTGQVAVTASAPTCAWAVSSGVSWITIQGEAGGTGSGRVSYAVASHGATAGRSGTLNVAGSTVTITQAAAPPPPCTFSVSPLEPSIALLGGVIDVQIQTAATCAWTADSQVNWITINGGASGTGPGSVRLSVGATLLTGRTGTVIVAGQTVTVRQTGLLGARD
jgi:hypothetical protein